MIFTTRTLRALCCGVLLCLAAGEVPSRDRLLQSPDVQVRVAPTPVIIAGQRHLAYELHISNFRSIDIALTRIVVTDAARGAGLADYRDAKLARLLGRPGVAAELTDRRVIGGGLRAVAFMWIALEESAVTPERLEHRIEFEVRGTSEVVGSGVEGILVDVLAEPPVVLHPPLQGGPWVALYEPSMVGGHRTSIYTIDGQARIPARFAIDWVKLGNDGSRARGDGAKVANWHGYGAEVLAVADALVTAAHDDMAGAESVGASQGSMSLENASGNYVTLDLGQGRFAFYEHLQHGSIAVKVGERVRRGQPLARLGNTGSSSSGPHLHFHLADANSTLGAEGVPYVFDCFEVVGGYDSIGAAVSDVRWNPAPRPGGGIRSRELPAPNVVVSFGTAAACESQVRPR